MNWSNVIEQRDAAGNLTDLALAVDALSDNGCDCGEDEPGTCLACVCERALRAQWEQWEALRAEVRSRSAHLSQYGRAADAVDELVDVLGVMKRIEAGKRGEELR
jgi:hypothetical protein